MAEKTRTQLKAYFETGDKPTQSQFIDLIDSVPNIQTDVCSYGVEWNITAHAGGGQANAYVLSKKVSQIETIADVGDSVILPVGTFVDVVVVVNAGSKDLYLYPPVGGQIASEGLNNPFAVEVGKVCIIYQASALVYYASLIDVS